MQSSFIAQLLEDSEPTPEAAAPVQTLALTDGPPAERPRSGSIARPMVARGTRMPVYCLWSTCDGRVSEQGGALYLCADCGTWFELKPADFGVYVGDLGDDFATRSGSLVFAVKCPKILWS